jgi:replicative DNA helicase
MNKTKTVETPDYSGLVFTPLEASNATEKFVGKIQGGEEDGMPLYIPKMEYDPKKSKGFLPVKRGELIAVLGRPGNGKTGFMFRWARMRANDLKQQAKDGNKTAANSVVLYFTMEQMVEELRLFHVAAEQGISATDIANGKLEDEAWERIKKALRGMHTTPLWLAGKSIERRKSKIKLTEEALRGILESIEKWRGDELEVQVDSVFVDYLQRFRSGGQDWVQFYGETYNGLKEMAGDFAARMIVGVQGRREIDTREVPIPQMDDGQWSSGIEQQSDGMLSVVRPSHYKSDGESFDDVIVKGHSQMIVSVLKRKLGPENFMDWVNFSPEYNRLDEAELKHHKFNEKYDV